MRCIDGRIVPCAWTAIFLLLAGCGSGGELQQQCYSLRQFSRMVTPSFSLYRMNTVAEGKNQTDIYVQLPYAKLRWEKQLSEYRASVTVLFLLRTAEGAIVYSKEMDRNIEAATYEETGSHKSEYLMERISVDPGEYALEVSSLDNISHLRYRIVEKITVPPFDSGGVSVSSVLLLNSIAKEGQTVSLKPLFPDYISYARDSVGYFQEVYNIRTGDTIRISHRYAAPVEEQKPEDDFLYWVPPYRPKHTDCRSDETAEYYRHDSVMVSNADGTVRVIQFFPAPKVGMTTVRREILVNSSSRRDTNSVTVQLYRRDPYYRNTVSPGEVLAALRYITRENEYDSLVSAAAENLPNNIEKFWDERGGRQSRIDFERRVHEANTLFTSCVDGSKTPMGIVYIVCGVPDYVDCRGMFAENWYYTIGERTYTAQFRPVGDPYKIRYYELAPFSINESFWQYNIDRWRRKK